MRLLLLFTIILLVVVGYIELYPTFGRKPDKKDQEAYQRRSGNYKDGRFFYDDSKDEDQAFSPYAHAILSKKGGRPKEKLPTRKPDFRKISKDDFNVTWFGHSSLLIQIHGKYILVDPVFARYASPVQFGLFKRFDEPVIQPEELPKIDLCLITHDHYDHLDYGTILRIRNKVKEFIVPLGLEKDLERWHINADRIKTMAWYEEIKIDGLTIGCTPGRHFSQRRITGRDSTLWCSFVLADEKRRIFLDGDSGFGHHYAGIHKKYPYFDVVFMECAQYDGRWANIHMFPENAIEAAKILHAKYLFPIHFGAYNLSTHPWDDPLERLSRHKKEIDLVTPLIGQTVQYKDLQKCDREWWKKVR